MATCPKCNGKLKITDWRPNCPHCGVNLVYYGMEERLLLDADKAEAEHAHFQKKMDRVKSAYAGSKLNIVRIILSVLPIPALLLPLAKMTFGAPFITESVSVNAISLYNVLSSLNFNAMFSLIESQLLGKTFICYAVSIVAIVLSLLMVLMHLILLFLSSSPKGKSRNFTLNALAIFFAVVATVAFSIFSKNAAAVFPTVITSGISFGIFAYIVAILLCIVINILVFNKNIEVKYKEVFVGGIPADEYFKLVEDGASTEEIRAEMSKRTAEKEAAEAAAKAEEEQKKLAEEEKETVSK